RKDGTARASSSSTGTSSATATAGSRCETRSVPPTVGAKAWASSRNASRPKASGSHQADSVALAHRARRGRNRVDAGTGIERTADVEPVVLGEGPEDPGVSRKVGLGEARHDATRIRNRNADLYVVAERERAPDPLVLDEAVGGRIDDHVHAEAPDVEAALRLDLPQPVQGRRRQDTDREK